MELGGGAILDGTPSAQLSALLAGIADISVDSAPKFTPDSCRRLVGLIVGRAYAPALLELCHLVRVAALAPRRRFELFFWGVPLARASAYAGWLRDTRARIAPVVTSPALPRVETEPGGVVVIYADGRFAISYGRMPVLVALMEFLVSSLGYGEVLERVERLLDGPASVAATGEIANEFSRAVYAWLAPHLPTAQEKRRLEALVAWLLDRRGARFTTDDIDDDAVLSFWLDADEGDFRTYASVLRGFLLLIAAMEDAAAAVGLARAAALGTDAEAGEMDPAAPGELEPTPGRPRVLTADEVDIGEDPLAALAEPPADAVKLLNVRERAELEQVLEAGPRGERLALSLARRAVFGAVQARISEALRRGGLPSAARLLAAVIEGIEPPRGEAGGYVAWCAGHDELAAHLERVMLASLHVLARAGRPEAVHLLLALGGDIGPGLERATDRLAELSRMLADPAVSGPATAALMLRARRSFQGLSRAGFEPDAAARRDIVDGHAAAAVHLPRLASRLRRARAALSRRPPERWMAQQETDRRLFAARFATLYGMHGEAKP